MAGAPMNAAQRSLFDLTPSGLVHVEEFVSRVEEAQLVREAETLPFKPFAFHHWFGKRETVSFGWRYDFTDSRVHEAPPIPEFLLALRARAATLAEVPANALEQALVIRYDAGAGIGWHRDRPVFDKVVGISLQGSCVLRFRHRQGRTFQRFALDAQPRSAYLLSGVVRHEWEHSIAPVEEPRYSITFRSRSDA